MRSTDAAGGEGKEAGDKSGNLPILTGEKKNKGERKGSVFLNVKKGDAQGRIRKTNKVF